MAQAVEHLLANTKPWVQTPVPHTKKKEAVGSQYSVPKLKVGCLGFPFHFMKGWIAARPQIRHVSYSMPEETRGQSPLLTMTKVSSQSSYHLFWAGYILGVQAVMYLKTCPHHHRVITWAETEMYPWCDKCCDQVPQGNCGAEARPLPPVVSQGGFLEEVTVGPLWRMGMSKTEEL
jgi:hypothetical protein